MKEPLRDRRQRQGLRLEIVEQQALFDYACRDQRGPIDDPWRIGEGELPAFDGASPAQHGRRGRMARERVRVEHSLGYSGICGRTYAGQHPQGRARCLDHGEAASCPDITYDQREGKVRRTMRHGAARTNDGVGRRVPARFEHAISRLTSCLSTCAAADQPFDDLERRPDHRRSVGEACNCETRHVQRTEHLVPACRGQDGLRKLDLPGVGLGSMNGQELVTVAAGSAARALQAGLHRHQPSAAARPSRAACGRSSTIRKRRRTTGSWRTTSSRTPTSLPAASCPCARTPAPRSSMGKKGRLVWTDGGDEGALADGIRDAYLKRNLRYSQLAPLSMFEEKNTARTCRRRSTSMPRARTPTSSCSSPRAAARPTRRSCTRRRPRCSPRTG